MQLKNIYTLFVLMVLLVVFQSRSAGPAAVASLEVAGAPGSAGDQGTCANSGCHIGGGFNATLTVELLEETSMEPVDEYEPGTSYRYRITMAADDGTPSGYGFQAVTLDDDDNSVSEWPGVQTGVQIVAIGDRSYIEHSAPSVSGVWENAWIAPATGSGDITFYSTGLAVNGNGSTNGDETVINTFTVSEKIESSTTQLDRDFARMTIAPNPIVDQAKVFITSQINGNYRLRIIDVTGKEQYAEAIHLQIGRNKKNINLDDLQSGLYFLQLVGEEHVSSRQLIKL